VNMGR